MPSITDYELEADVRVNGATITAIVDGEEQDEVDIIGYLMSYTIGSDFLIVNDPEETDETGREWLLRRMGELGLPEWMAPPEVTPKRAFNRTRDHLIDPDNEDSVIRGRETAFETNKVNNDEWHINAKAYFDAEELDQEDGEFRTATLGICRYSKENEGILTIPKVSEDDPLWDRYHYFAEKAMKMFEQMQSGHIGRDIQKMLNRFTSHWTNDRIIRLRSGGAVYFVPAGYGKYVDGLTALIKEMGVRFKEKGRACEIIRVPVMDSDEQREQVEERAREALERQVEDAFGAAFDTLAEDETVAEDVAKELEGRLEELDEFSDDYNALLSARLSARKVVEQKLDELSGEKEELVESALEDAEVPEPTT